MAKHNTANTAPQAPVYTVATYNPATKAGWPVKAQQGNSIRAYCYSVACKLAKAQPGGFTLAQYAAALAQYAKGSTYKQPSTGWGAPKAPNSAAHAHANWFAGNKQQWLVPAKAPKAPAKARKAPAKAPASPAPQAPAPAPQQGS